MSGNESGADPRQDQSREDWQHLAQECAGKWHDFGRQPGISCGWYGQE